jgi:hypothetical protein
MYLGLALRVVIRFAIARTPWITYLFLNIE